MTNREVYEQGEVLIHWPCDCTVEGETESNGGVELFVEHKSRVYGLIVSPDWTRIMNEDMLARPLNDEDEHRVCEQQLIELVRRSFA